MTLYCPASGMRVLTRPEWTDQKVSDTFIANFWILGDSIVYSRPRGRADLLGVQNSVTLKSEIIKHLPAGAEPYIQIQDYADLTGSSQAARSYFISNVNEDPRLLSMIFCNLSPPLALAVRIGNRFNSASNLIHITKHYRDAIQKAFDISTLQPQASEVAGIDIQDCLLASDVSMKPIDLLVDPSLNIITPEYSNRAVIIDNCILHSTSKGYLKSEHIPIIDRMRFRCHDVMPRNATIQYILINSSNFSGGSRVARTEYLQSLKRWHQQFPIRLFVVYGGNTFVKTALQLYRTLLPFKIRPAQDLRHALDLINDDRSGKRSKRHQPHSDDKMIPVHKKDLDQMIAFIGSLDWGLEGIDHQYRLPEEHPLYFLYQSIKLVKEELDELFRERAQLEAQLRQSQKMEAIGTLAGGIAHDFNNILASVLGFTELALDDVDKNSSIGDNLNEVLTAGKRARDLVKQILAYARQSEEQRKPIHIRPIVKEVLSFLRSTIPSTIAIEQHIDSDALIMGNATQVHQILLNLCTNAAQAIEERGIIRITVKNTVVDDHSPALKSGLKQGEYVEIGVSDTGSGIAPDHMGSIFEPYFTSKEPGEGTGMGLAMVQGIVESYGGKIRVKSLVGEGSTFSVYLPVITRSQEQIPQKQEALPTGNERILLVDDEPAVAKMTSKTLSSMGYSVATITDSLAALAVFTTEPESFDLVITDMTMPDMTGDKLAAEILKCRPDIPIILCTGFNKTISGESASKIGIKVIVNKPIVKAELARVVRNVIDGAV